MSSTVSLDSKSNFFSVASSAARSVMIRKRGCIMEILVDQISRQYVVVELKILRLGQALSFVGRVFVLVGGHLVQHSSRLDSS